MLLLLLLLDDREASIVLREYMMLLAACGSACKKMWKTHKAHHHHRDRDFGLFSRAEQICDLNQLVTGRLELITHRDFGRVIDYYSGFN